ncbi:hypothetical protein EIP86_007493 [Pleurotus ostreatoroseus]|nr:hypothetical protein EIP86_007493 [Pleurotus ostreatoroseus]
MKTTELLESYDKAPPLSLCDLLLTKEEQELHRCAMVHIILRIIITYGGERFSKFRDNIHKTLPVTSEQIPVSKTTIYPLPTMDIDESSTRGNADVVDAIFTELKHDLNSADFFGTVHPTNGDQLSIARLRGSSNDCIGHHSLRQSYLNLSPANGFFHGELHLAFGTLETHFGNPSLGPHDPGSLCFHNTVLDRKPIVLSSLPPYRTCRDLVFTSLYARVLHCLKLLSRQTLQDYTEDLTFERLQVDAEALFDKFANSPIVDRLCAERAAADSNTDSNITQPLCRDMVFENAILTMRDSFIMREFTDAVEAGDSRQIIICLKNLALFYRGCGHTKYAFEMLVLIHHLTHIWPKPLRTIIIKNWLMNPTGRPNSFVLVDLLQEHMNFWIKLKAVAPPLAMQINEKLGFKQGSKHHASDLTVDIRELMKSLRRHHVYEQQPGRTIEGVKVTVPDVLIAGLQGLKKPLDDYNSLFLRLRARRRVQPLITDGWKAPRMQAHAAVDIATIALSALDADSISLAKDAFSISDDSSASERKDDESLADFVVDGTHEEEFRCSIDTEADVELDLD